MGSGGGGLGRTQDRPRQWLVISRKFVLHGCFACDPANVEAECGRKPSAIVDRPCVGVAVSLAVQITSSIPTDGSARGLGQRDSMSLGHDEAVCVTLYLAVQITPYHAGHVLNAAMFMVDISGTLAEVCISLRPVVEARLRNDQAFFAIVCCADHAVPCGPCVGCGHVHGGRWWHALPLHRGLQQGHGQTPPSSRHAPCHTTYR